MSTSFPLWPYFRTRASECWLEHPAGIGVTVNSVTTGRAWSEGAEKFVGDLAAAQGRSAAQVEKVFLPRSGRRFIQTGEIAAVRTEGGILHSLF